MQVWIKKACNGTRMCPHTPYMKHTGDMSHRWHVVFPFAHDLLISYAHNDPFYHCTH